MMHLSNKSVAFLALLFAVALSACNNDATAQSKVTSPNSSSAQTHTNTQTPSNDPLTQTLQQNINKAGLSARVLTVHPTEMPNMYLANIEGMPPVFTDPTGSYIIQGDIIKLDNPPINITQKAQSAIAKQALAAVDKSEMIIFPAKGTTKAAIYVFSDPTCHYCQLLHKEINQTNAAGIEVRYLAWPRGEQTIPMTEAIWCSKDRHKAITDAKKGKAPKATQCDNPVHKHLALGYSLGVNGTPAVFTESGEQIGGYLPSAQLAEAAIAGK